ncbi:MAG: hypothetical protein WC285_05265 [Candidatus Gracilibacteria bacterium]|jgi:hypothetical protein
MKTEYIVLIGTLGGAFLGFLSAIITTCISKHYEDKKVYRNLLVEAGLKNWEGSKDVALKLLDKGQSGKLSPLDLFIIHQSKIIDLIMENNLSEETLRKALEETRKLKKVFTENTEKIQNNI